MPYWLGLSNPSGESCEGEKCIGLLQWDEDGATLTAEEADRFANEFASKGNNRHWCFESNVGGDGKIIAKEARCRITHTHHVCMQEVSNRYAIQGNSSVFLSHLLLFSSTPVVNFSN